MEAYILLQFIMKKFRLDSAEEALKKVQALKICFYFSPNHLSDQLMDESYISTV